MPDKYLVVSDLHIGSPFYHRDLLEKCLDRIRGGIGIVFAGDIVDDPVKPLSTADTEMVDAIVKKSLAQEIIWLEGNHDDRYRPTPKGNIVFLSHYAEKSRFLIIHGDAFDDVMPRYRFFVRLLKTLHELRIRFGAHPVHVAQFAKRLPLLYRYLRKTVMLNAVKTAKKYDVQAVICGHVHHAEQRVVDAVRYFNLGAWTEEPVCCLLIDEKSLRFMTVQRALRDRAWFHQATSGE